MSTNWIAWVGAPLLAAPLFAVNDGAASARAPARGDGEGGGLQRVHAKDDHDAVFDAAAWKRRLLAQDLAERERGFDAVLDEARENDAAREQLEAWSRDASQPDLAWTSRLALRELRASPRLRAPAWTMPRGGQDWNDLRSRFDDLQQRFGGLDSMFDDMQRRMDRAFRGMHAQPFAHGLSPQGGLRKQESQSYSLQVGPDGVKVEVSEDVDGKQETKTYTAKSLDELYDAHPELRDKIGARVDVQGGRGFDFFDDMLDVPHAMPAPGDRPAQPLQPSAVRTDILGVMISTPDADARKAAKVDEGVGLKVESVQPGTIASRIGIESGDIVIEVNGRTVKSVDDVRAALRERRAGEDVSVTVVEEDGARRVLTWRAESEPRSF